MKKKQKVQIFKLEERVLFDGAAAAEIAAAVDQAAEQNQNQADNQSDNSEQDNEEKLIRNTVQNAGPVDTPAPDATVQNAGEGLPQADAARNDPAEVLINGNADFTQVTDPQAQFSGDVAEFIQDAADPDAEADSHELIVIDSEAADQFDQDAFEGKNVLFLDGDSDAADQIEDWMNEHSDRDISEVRLVTDSDTLASQISDIDVDVVTVDAFQTELGDADSSDLIIFPDPSANITVDAPADELPDELTRDAAEGRHELVIVNSTTADLDNVLEQIGDSRDVLILDSQSDPFDQISEYLENSGTSYDAVHILTHGSDDNVFLGGRIISQTSSFSVFQGHLNEGADMLFYGCNMASTEAGQNFLLSIADVTGADVAASVDITGSLSRGGNWTLEYASGSIETASISLDSSWNYAFAEVVIQQNEYISKYADYLNSNDVVLYNWAVTTDNSMETAGKTLFLPADLTISMRGGATDVTIRTKVAPYSSDSSLILNDADTSGKITLVALDGSELPKTTLNVNSALQIEGTVTQISSISGVGSLTVNAGATLISSGSGAEIPSAFIINEGATWEITNNATISLDTTLTIGNDTVLLLNNGNLIGQVTAGSGATLSLTNGGSINGSVKADSGATLSLTNGSINGQVTVNSGATLSLTNGTINDTVDLKGTLNLTGSNTISTLNYNAGSTLNYDGASIKGTTFNIGQDFIWNGNISFDNVSISKSKLTINDVTGSTFGDLTIPDKSVLVLNCDISLGNLILENGAAFSYKTGGIKVDGNIDYGLAGGTINATDGLTVTGTLTMRSGTTFNLNDNFTVETLRMDEGSTFNSVSGKTLYGNFDNAVADLDPSNMPNFTGSLTMRNHKLTLDSATFVFPGLTFIGENAKLINTNELALTLTEGDLKFEDGASWSSEKSIEINLTKGNIKFDGVKSVLDSMGNITIVFSNGAGGNLVFTNGASLASMGDINIQAASNIEFNGSTASLTNTGNINIQAAGDLKFKNGASLTSQGNITINLTTGTMEFDNADLTSPDGKDLVITMSTGDLVFRNGSSLTLKGTGNFTVSTTGTMEFDGSSLTNENKTINLTTGELNFVNGAAFKNLHPYVENEQLTLTAGSVKFADSTFVNSQNAVLTTDSLVSNVDLNWAYDPETQMSTEASLTIKPKTEGGEVSVDLNPDRVQGGTTMSAYNLTLDGCILGSPDNMDATLFIYDEGFFSMINGTRNYYKVKTGADVTFLVTEDTAIGTVTLTPGSILAYVNGITMSGSIDFNEGAYIYAVDPVTHDPIDPEAKENPSYLKLSEEGKFSLVSATAGDGWGVLTMEAGTTLDLQTDVTITTVQLKQGSGFQYTNGVTITGSLDYGQAGEELTINDTDSRLSITDTLTMESGTTLDLQTNNANIGSISLMKDAQFKYIAGLVWDNPFSTAADLQFDNDITFKDSTLSISSDTGITVLPGVTLNLIGETITVEEGSLAVNAIINAGTVNFIDSGETGNKIVILNEQPYAYAAILNKTIDTGSVTGTGTVNLNDASLTIDYSAGTSPLTRSGIQNNGAIYDAEGNPTAKAALNMDNGHLTVTTGNSRSQTGYAVNNTVGEVTIMNGSTVSLTAYGSESAAIMNARDQHISIGQADTFDGTVISAAGGGSAYSIAAVANDGNLTLDNCYLTAENGLPILRDSQGNLYQYSGQVEGTHSYSWNLNGQTTVYSDSLTPVPTEDPSTGEMVFAPLYISRNGSETGGLEVLSVEDSSVTLFNATNGTASFTVDVKKDGTYAQYAQYVGEKLELWDTAAQTRWNNMSEAERMLEFSKTVFSITNNGSTYGDVTLKGHSVVNQNYFEADTAEMTFSYNLTFYHDDNSLTLNFADTPVAALNGAVKQIYKASTPETSMIRLDNMTINGDLHLIGNANFTRRNFYLNGDLVNEGNNIRITGLFVNASDFTVTLIKTTAVGKDEYRYQGSYEDGITVINREYAPASYGNVYLGGPNAVLDPEADTHIVFSSERPYGFYNYSGEMNIYDFSGLGWSETLPLEVYNSGVFKIDNDTSSEVPLDMYVKGFSRPEDIRLNGNAFSNTVSSAAVKSDVYARDFFDSVQASIGINDRGVTNFNSYSYGQLYPVPNSMTVTDLNLKNANSQATAITNVGGVLTVVRGSLQGSYSGLDLSVKVDATAGSEWTVITPETVLTDVVKVAGGAAAIRNSGRLTMDGANVKDDNGNVVGTLLTNEIDFGESYGEFVALGNYTFTVYLNESAAWWDDNVVDYDVYYKNDLGVYGYSGLQFYNMHFTLSKYSGGTPLTPDEFQLYYVSASAVNDRSQVTIGSSSGGGGRVYSYGYDYLRVTDFAFGNYFGMDNTGEHLFSGYSKVTNVAFKSKPTPYNTTAIRNWGELTMSGINDDADYRFTGFNNSIDNGYNTYWASDYAYVYGTLSVAVVRDSGDDELHTQLHLPNSPAADIKDFTVKADVSLSFSISAASVKTSDQVTWIKLYAREEPSDHPDLKPDGREWPIVTQSVGELTLRGVETGTDTGLYTGSIEAEGANYAVYKTQTLTLVNFSVNAHDTTSAIQNYGKLYIFNGKDIGNGIYKGASNASISATGGTAIINHGYLAMFNGAVTDSHIGIDQQYGSGVAMAVVNSTFYNNDIGIQSDAAASGMNLVVADTTIVSAKEGSIGIRLTRGTAQLDLANSIILVNGGQGLVNTVGATVNQHGTDDNIVGTAQNTAQLMQDVYGTDFDGIGNNWEDSLKVLFLADESLALNGGITVNSTFSGGKYSFTFGGSSGNILWDKAGNDRTGEIGSYVIVGKLPPKIVVNTLKDSYNVETQVYSLRYVIDYLQSAENTAGSNSVRFDWEKLIKEAAGNTTLQFVVSAGSLTADSGNAAGISELRIDASNFSDPSSNVTAIVIGSDQLAGSLFTVTGMQLAVVGTSAVTFTVNGSGTAAASVNVDGAAFNLADAAKTSLTLENVTVSDGITAGNGGAVYVGANAELTASGTTFSGNAAANGGAVYVSGSAVLKDGVTLTGNTAAEKGGAVYNAGTLTVSNSDPAQLRNSINTNTAADGAGIYQADGSMSLSYLSVYGNELSSAAGTGNALYLAGGEAGLYNVTIANHASNNNADAAAVYNGGADLSVYNTVIGLNETAGINAAGGTTGLYNSLVIGNGATGYENVIGVYTDDGHSLVGTSENQYSATLIFGNSAFDPDTGVIILNPDSSNPALLGGALYADPDGNYFDQLGNDRTKTPGGGVYTVGSVVGDGTPPEPPKPQYLIVNTFADDNTENDKYSLREAVNYLQLEYNTEKHTDIIFDYDALAAEAGDYDPANWNFVLDKYFGSLQLNGVNDAGIAKISIDGKFTDDVGNTQVMTIDGSALTNASMFSVVGMELALSNFTVQGPSASTVNGSVANVSGTDGVISFNGNMTVKNAKTTGNGTIYVANGAGFITEGTGNTFTGNSARNGGVIYNAGGTVTVGADQFGSHTTGYFMSGNKATDKGGVIYNESGVLNIGYLTMSENSAPDGSAVYLKNGTAYIFASTFVANSGNGYVITAEGGELNMAQVTVGFNEANGVKITGDAKGNANIWNSVIAGNGSDEVYGLTEDQLKAMGTVISSNDYPVETIFVGGSLDTAYDSVTGTLQLAVSFANPAIAAGLASSQITGDTGIFGIYHFDNADYSTPDQAGSVFYGNGGNYVAGARVIDSYPTDIPWKVTTGQDVVDPDDGMTSLREAVKYVNEHGTPTLSVLFDTDAIIKNDKSSSATVTVTEGTLNIRQVGGVTWSLDASDVVDDLTIVSSMGDPLFTIAGKMSNGATFTGNENVTIKGGTGGIFKLSGNTEATVRDFNITLSTTSSGQTVTEDGPAFIVSRGALNVKDVTVKSATSNIFNLTGGTTNVSGGSYRITDSSTTHSLITAADAVLNITGGTFSSPSNIITASGSSAVSIADGTFSSPSSIITASGSSSVNIADGTFTVTNAAESGVVMISGSADTTTTIAGGKFQISSADGVIVSAAGNLTINGGEFTAKAADVTAVRANGSGALSITDGTFTGYNKTGIGVDATSGSGSFSISGGTFSGFETGVKVNRAEKAGAVISDGQFTANIYGVNNSDHLTISGGTFQNNADTLSNPTKGAGILNSGTLSVSGVTAPISGSFHGVENSGTIKSFAGTSDSHITISNNKDSGFYNTGTVKSMEYVTLSGNGRAKTTQGGGIYNSGRIAVDSKTEKDPIRFHDITITGNSAKQGGGIYNSGNIGIYVLGSTNISLDTDQAGNVKVTGNDANQGGGVYWADGWLSTDMFVTAGTTPTLGLESNYAAHGGGMYVAVTSHEVLIKGTDSENPFIFAGNAAIMDFEDNDSAFEGGALYIVSGAKVTLLDVTFTSNIASNVDVIVNSYDKYMYGRDTGNVDGIATNVGGRGGAVYNAGTLSVMTSEFAGNGVLNANNSQFPNYELYLQTLSMGGAVYNAGTLTVTDSWIHENIAYAGLGGGVYNAEGATLTLESSEPYTGQHWISTEPEHSNSMIIENNSAYSWSDGTMYAGGGFGGGIYADSGSTVSLDSVTVRKNIASLEVSLSGGSTTYDIGRGAGIYFGEANVYVDALGTKPALGNGTLTIDGTIRNAEYEQFPAQYERMRRASDISGNTAAVGAGLFVDTKGTVTVHNTEIHGNNNNVEKTLFTSADAAKDFYKVFWVTSEQSEYARTQQHSAPPDDALAAVGEQFTTSGIGMYAMGDGATITLSNSKVGETDIPGVSIHDNNGTGGLGGGLYVSTNPYEGSSEVKVTLQDSSVYDNTGKLGGGIYLSSGNLTVTNDLTYGYNSSIHGNSAEYGAGIYQAGGTLNVSYQAFYGNTLTADYGTGAALYLDGGTAKVYNVTIANHTASNANAAAVYVAYSDLEIYNSTIGLNGTIGIRNAFGTKDDLKLFNTLVIGNGATGYNNVVGDYTATASLVDQSAALIFGSNVFNPETGVIVLNQDSSNPARTGGALYPDAQGNYYDQLGNDRQTMPGGEVYTVGALVGSGIPPLPPPPEYLVVNTFSEDGNPSDDVVSLREAILYLQSEYNTDRNVTVKFDYNALAREAAMTGGWDFNLEDSFGSLQLNSSNDAGIRQITIDGSDAPQKMTINGSELTNSVFTVVGMELALSNITVTGPAASTVNGSVANVSGTDSAISFNGNVTVKGAKTTGNGTIYVADGGKVTAVGFGNSITDNTAANGGAVYVANGGRAALNGITITGNNATDGGAVYVAVGGNADLTGNTITGNSATNGGALYNAGTAVITGNISGNSALNGAGIFNTGSLTVTGDIANNTATGNGGALYNAGTATVNGDITGNNAVNGAGIYMPAGSVTLNGDLMNNTASGEGAALYIAGGKFSTNGNVTGNTGTSIIYAADGMAQFGDLDHYIDITGNTGILVKASGGDVLIVNASIRDNNAGTASLFEVSGGFLTMLNTTITGNTGDVLNQTGGTVQIGDTTIYEPDDVINFNGGTLNVLNSIINASNAFTATNTVGSLINAAPADVFKLDGSGNPVDGANGTLQIKPGIATSGGVMTGYTQDAVRTTLYYTTDGSTWHDAAGSAVSVAPTTVTHSQNGAVRLSGDYAFLSIGAYSLNASMLVVTVSGDKPVEGETTLREALEFAEFLYGQDGQTHTVTFAVDKIDLDSTITVENPVAVSGSGVTISAVDGTAPFAGDSVFVVDAGSSNAVNFSGVTIKGKEEVRGIEVKSGDLNLFGVSIENGLSNGWGSETVPTKEGGAIYVTGGGDVTGRDVILSGNFGTDGAAIYTNGSVGLENFTIRNNYVGNSDPSQKGSVIKMTNAGSELLLRNGTVTGNGATSALISTEGTAKLISVSAYDNGLWSSLLRAGSADVVNSTLTGDPANNAALVRVMSDLNAANSVIVTSRPDGPAVLAGEVKPLPGGGSVVIPGTIRSAYSIYSGYLEDVSVDVNNLIGVSYGDVFESGTMPPTVREDSPAAIGVWTAYDPATRQISYTERPEDIWTEGYRPERMQWRYLGGGAASYQPSLLVGGDSKMPSIGANWIRSGQNHPDYGPGVDYSKYDPNYNGGFGEDWGYSSVVNRYLMDPEARLSDETESGMGWYASMLSELFGIRKLRAGILSVTGGIPSDELELSVDAETEDFGEFQEAPYRADDGTPLSQEELDAIRNAAVRGRIPADSVHLEEAVHEKVAASLRSSDLFKDSFDKALDVLLGLDA